MSRLVHVTLVRFVRQTLDFNAEVPDDAPDAEVVCATRALVEQLPRNNRDGHWETDASSVVYPTGVSTVGPGGAGEQAWVQVVDAGVHYFARLK